MATPDDIDSRLARIEAHLAIRDLVARYAVAVAVDARDLDALAALWSPHAWMGRAHGLGGDGVRSFYRPILSRFYRSVHMIGGQTIDVDDTDHAHGVVYCKAEHEIADRWIVQAIAYADTYARVDGTWRFVRRVPNTWYTAPLDDQPTGPLFDSWPGDATRRTPPDLPRGWPSWHHYWNAAGTDAIERVTHFPVGFEAAPDSQPSGTNR